MSPSESYRDALSNGAMLADPAQARAVERLQDLHQQLLVTSASRRHRLLPRWRRRASPPVRGLYLWGGVGRGKTHLMDLFFHSLPLAEKRRTHFHRFMGDIHRHLQVLRGQPDPLRRAARRIAGSTRLLCLDEFQVWDIGDAMILERLLGGLFQAGVTLVATSNTAPDELYPNGLQRALFLPAIERIKVHTQVVELQSDTDYRLRLLEQAPTYHLSLGGAADRALNDTFERIAPEPGIDGARLRINDRVLETRRVADSVLWVDYPQLCDRPRGQADYLELARCYHTVLLSNVPRMGDERNDQAKRFIHLIDVLYDHNVTLIISAAAVPEGLYTGQVLRQEFRRTASRLQEMRSRDWLERPHLG
jgi:cell division protein ZapE